MTKTGANTTSTIAPSAGNKKKQKILNFDPSKDGYGVSTTLHNLNSQNFINSQKIGYLTKIREGWYKQWKESRKLCVMTNVGLLYFNEADKRPRNIFPTIDAVVTKLKPSTYKRKWVFKLKSFKWEIVFAANDEQDFNEWMAAIESVQKQADAKQYKKTREASEISKRF